VGNTERERTCRVVYWMCVIEYIVVIVVVVVVVVGGGWWCPAAENKLIPC
jgi:hypothetical protein